MSHRLASPASEHIYGKSTLEHAINTADEVQLRWYVVELLSLLAYTAYVTQMT